MSLKTNYKNYLMVLSFFLIQITLLLFLNQNALAQVISDQPTYPTVIDDTVNISDPQMEDLTFLVLSIIRFLTGFAGGVIIVMIVYGGFQHITGYMTGDEEGYNNAKATFIHAITGLIVILTSYLIVTMFQSAITSTSFN
jgi:hypothetical protein